MSACVPTDKQVSYRGRKNVVTQNVLCACNFEMFFTFVSAGWEGTANDSRVFIDAITKPKYKFPLPKEGIESLGLNYYFIIYVMVHIEN